MTATKKPVHRTYSEEPFSLETPGLPQDKKNVALRLAERADFFTMCAAGLWGDEPRIYEHQFGEMLRGLVEQFLPRNVWELELLSQVAVAYWKVNRLIRTQTNIYNAELASGQIGRHGLPAALGHAESFDSRIQVAQKGLNYALGVFQASRRLEETEKKASAKGGKNSEEGIEWFDEL